LNKEIRVDEITAEIVNIFNNFKSNNRQDLLAQKGVMDMTPKSVFVKQIPDELYKKYLMSLESFDLLIPEETHEFLVSFFEQVSKEFILSGECSFLICIVVMTCRI